MRTNNAMQLKAKIKARAKQAGVSPQLLLQDYLLERLLERLSRSRWRERVIVKGGMLIASYMGIDSRVTKDLDTTVRGFDLTHESAEAVFKEIIAVEADDGLVFEFGGTEYRTLQDLFVSAEIDDLYLTFIYNKLYNFKVGRRNKEAKKKMLS